MAPPPRPAGVLISVKDLGRSTAFYTDVLGFEVETSDADVVVLGGGDPEFPHLAQGHRASPRGPDSLGVRALFLGGRLPSGT